MNGLLIALVIILAYLLIAYVLNKRGILARYNMSLWGPFIMWRTKRGRDVIDRLARPTLFWKGYATLGKAVVIAVMIGIMALLIWEAFLVTNIPADQAPDPIMLIGLPGINPIIPIWYGILGLVIAVFIHEFAHGILTRVGEMKIRALGIVFLVLPMGAFVEPDEEALVKVERKKRTSVYAVGPATNIIAAVICAILFSSVMVSSAEPARDNPVITSIVVDTPAANAGLQFGDQVFSINGVEVPNGGYASVDAPDPNTTVSMQYYRGNELRGAQVISGVVVTLTASNLPADQAGLEAGMILTSLNGTIIRNEDGFRSALLAVTPETTVPVTALVFNATAGQYENAAAVTSITPLSKQEYFEENFGQTAEDISYIGVNTAYLGAGTGDPQVLLNRLANPFANADTFGEYVAGALIYIALPFTGLQPLQEPLTEIFVPGGIFAWMSADIFWMVANSLYWIFWINLMVGMTNALPAIPLDGGFLYRDWIDSLVARFKKGWDQKDRDKLVNPITMSTSLLVLFLIVWQLIGPRVL
jgi:membrane-associated protease RseP (regulator of RpoE activity)